MATTEIGKELRKLRIEEEERLADMAKRLKKSPSFISAIEVGGKSPPAGFDQLVIQEYALNGERADRITVATDRSAKAFKVQPTTDQGRDTAALFAREINNLSDDALKDIQAILKRGGT